MKTFHVISAKEMGWETKYQYFFFPTDVYTKDEALAQFTPVQKETLKDNNRWYSYTAYEFEGETFYSIEYSGTATEDEVYNY